VYDLQSVYVGESGLLAVLKGEASLVYLYTGRIADWKRFTESEYNRAAVTVIVIFLMDINISRVLMHA
jgi:hypothetical protein